MGLKAEGAEQLADHGAINVQVVMCELVIE